MPSVQATLADLTLLLQYRRAMAEEMEGADEAAVNRMVAALEPYLRTAIAETPARRGKDAEQHTDRELPRSYSRIMRTMKLGVECYSGRKADEKPVRFWLGGRQYQVETVLDQWYDPEHVFYKVRADDRNLYILKQQTSTPDGQWELVSFRQTKEER